ncbi:MAG: GTPase HflX [Spirochaetes bacterium]|nr:GTPase HflX [Spirochaetota bacterium]
MDKTEKTPVDGINTEKAWIVGINFQSSKNTKEIKGIRQQSCGVDPLFPHSHGHDTSPSGPASARLSLHSEINNHLDELSSLLKTLGVETAGRSIASVKKPLPAFLIGTGKADEIISNASESDSSIIVFDDDLSPAQQKNWEKLSKKRVIDRREVIINIFAERAKTKEASLQVELAHCQYTLPRLTRAWTHLSRQRGGSYGTKGTGETQLETDRRALQKKIAALKKELKTIEKQRQTRRKLRENREIFSCSIAGYTNAGKSTLLNRLTGASVSTNNRLFDTLDPVTRKLFLSNEQEVVITDTVGFIRKLPHQLIEAFKSTLEETVFADLVILLLDASSSEVKSHYQTSMEVLKEIGVEKEKVMPVFNKADIASDTSLFEEEYSNSLFISALDGENIDKFVEEIKRRLQVNQH